MSESISSEYKVKYESSVTLDGESYWYSVTAGHSVNRKGAVEFISAMQRNFSDSMRNFKLITIDSFPNPGD